MFTVYRVMLDGSLAERTECNDWAEVEEVANPNKWARVRIVRQADGKTREAVATGAENEAKTEFWAVWQWIS